jgi:hypothetical protein
MNRTLTLVCLLLFGLGASAQEVWDDFDDRRQLDYGFIHGEFFPYQENPGPDAVNGSPMVAQYLRNPVEVFDVILTNPGALVDISDYLAGTASMTLDVYAPAAGITVQITLEDSVTAGPTNYPTGRRAEFTAVTTTAGAWETLTLTLAGEPDPSVPNDGVNRAVLLFNPSVTGAQTWYFDNWNGPARQSVACDPPVDDPLLLWDGECEQDVTFTFQHGVMRRRFNPDTGGDNASPYALRYDRNVGELDDVILGTFPAALNASAGSKMYLDVYDVNAPSVYIMAIQNSAGDDIVALADSTAPGEVNAWTTLEYDLSGLAGETDATRFVLLYKPGAFLVGRTFLDNWRTENPVGIAPSPVTASLDVWPNPANARATVELPALPGEARLQAFDALGRAVGAPLAVAPGTTRVDLNTAAWAPGTYVLRLEGGASVHIARLMVGR